MGDYYPFSKVWKIMIIDFNFTRTINMAIPV